MSSDGKIILIDIPSKPPCRTWSLNPWKTRFLLNYKKLDYVTDWTEYPDIKPRLEKHLPPNKAGSAYTSPTVQLPDGTYVMDSKAIAIEIEKRYPNPSVHLDSPVLPKVEDAVAGILSCIRGVFVPLAPERVLNEASHAHFISTREKAVGMPLAQFAKEKGGQQAWEAARTYLDQVSALLKEDASGPFFLGQEVSYADFVWGGFLIFTQKFGDECWGGMMKVLAEDSDVHNKLLLGLSPWSERDDK